MARAEVERAARAAREVEVKVVQAELVAPGGEAEEAVRAELTDTLTMRSLGLSFLPSRRLRP